MKHAFVTVAATLGVAAFAVPLDEVAFAPEEGAELTKTFTLEVELERQSSVTTFDQDERVDDAEASQSHVRQVTVTDAYVGVGGGRPTKLERTFDALTMSSTTSRDGDETEHDPLESELEDSTVVFTWDEDAEEYEVDWGEDDSGDDELLEKLVEDMDLRDLLPRGEVDEGDEWEIDGALVTRLLLAGGDLSLAADEWDSEPLDAGFFMVPTMPSDPREWFAELEGDVTAEYEGLRDEDDVEVAVIALELELEVEQDLMEHFAAELDENISVDTAGLEVELEGEGELLWNAETGHLHALEIEAELVLRFELAMTFGQSFELGQREEHEGELTIEVKLGDGDG